MTNPRVTLRSIAEVLGLHHSTVSRALKNDRRIPAETRERILKLARELGYQPDPMLSALMTYRKGRSAQERYRATLGWITNYPTRDGWREYEKNAYFRGASRRAAELGYTLEEFWLAEPGLTQKRAIQILEARNIHGLFFIPPPRSRAHLMLDWSRFAAITFGRTLASPVFHNVDNDHFRSLAVLMRQLKRLGYRRPGFASWPRIHESNDRAWTAAFGAYQGLPPRDQIPVFMHQPWTPEAFRQWFLDYKPDVVVTHDETLLGWIENWGLKVPRDVGFVLAAKHGEASPRCSGIDENSEMVAEVAVNVLVDMINRGETGIPRQPISTMVEGRWIEGDTLRRQKPVATAVSERTSRRDSLPLS